MLRSPLGATPLGVAVRVCLESPRRHTSGCGYKGVSGVPWEIHLWVCLGSPGRYTFECGFEGVSGVPWETHLWVWLWGCFQRGLALEPIGRMLYKYSKWDNLGLLSNTVKSLMRPQLRDRVCWGFTPAWLLNVHHKREGNALGVLYS